MNSLKSVLCEENPVTSADTDFSRHLSLSALVNMHIQIAWHHAEHLGFGMEFLHENGLVWMLSRMHIKIRKYPFWNENLSMQTWPKGIRRLFYLRDFYFTDKQDHVVSETTSEWLIINWATKRPKLYNPEHNIFNENLEKHALEEIVPVLSTPDTIPERFFNRVVYSDIDLNQHLTTTHYIDWMLDCFDLGYLRDHQCSELVINFIKEIPYDSQVEIRRHYQPADNAYLFEFVLPENNILCFRGFIGFTNRKSGESPSTYFL